MAIGKIREIGGKTRAKDLENLVRGERILLKGVGTDTQEESGSTEEDTTTANEEKEETDVQA